MKFTPREYQGIISRFIMNHPRCSIWSDMGTGKGAATLTALHCLSVLEEAFPALVLAPVRVATSVWPGELSKWDDFHGLRVQVAAGNGAERRRAALQKHADIYTTNYENLPWLVHYYQEKGKSWPFRTVIADECTRLKGFRLRQGGFRAATLAKVAHHPRTRRWVNLTGTPAPNGLLDLWGPQWFVDGGVRLGRSFGSYQQRWFRASPNGFDFEPLPFAEEQIHKTLADCCLTIRAGDWFDLKAPIVNNLYVDLPQKAAVAYRAMERKLFMELDGIEFEAFSAAAKSQKCLQLASGAVYLNQDEDAPPLSVKPYQVAHDVKLEALQSIIEEAGGHPIMVAYHFRSDLERLKAKFKQARELRTQKDEDDWNSGKIAVLLAHPASAGHGLNLQHGGNTIVFFSHDWNLENYQQIIERIGPVRQMQSGYDRPVYIHHIIARGTLDEVVMARREGKRQVQDLLKEAMLLRRESVAA